MLTRVTRAALVFMFLAASGVSAQEADKPAPAADQAVVPAASEAPAAPAGTAEPAPLQTVMKMDMAQSGNVTFDFRDADIRNVLKVLAYKSGVNIIAGPEVVGLVTIQLKDVPWERALDVVLSTYGYGYEKKGSIIMVTTVDILKKRRADAKDLVDQEPIGNETFLLSFSKAEEVAKTLEKIKTARGNINFDQRTNAVIVSDVESNLVLIRDVVKKLDTITPQVMIEARIIETTLNKQETLGLTLPDSIGGTVTIPSRSHNFPWSNKGYTYLPAATATAPTFNYGTISFDSLAATLDMLKSRTDTNILSNPRIVTLDNQPAKISVGTKHPLPKYAYSDSQDRLTISGWEYIEFGLTFNVTPHINGKGVVTLDIEPVIMDSSSSVPFDFGGTTTTDIPILSTESAKTRVMIRDGQTLVIAGLIRDRKVKVSRRVPVLGDIPFLGAPFRHKDETNVKTELLIFLTPHIVTPEDMVEVVAPTAPAAQGK